MEKTRNALLLECPKESCDFNCDDLDKFIDHVKTHGVKTPGIEKINGTYQKVVYVMESKN
ncbi:MAG: hypothetical protein H8D23_09570 [Candidatus Brocadiales bacterium]|nr:hypothetical protein [Candidatus Brocadiales bacterium]